MGMREEVKSGRLSSEDALAMAEKFEFPGAPKLVKWLQTRIALCCDSSDATKREKKAEAAKKAKEAAKEAEKVRRAGPSRRRQKRVDTRSQAR